MRPWHPSAEPAATRPQLRTVERIDLTEPRTTEPKTTDVLVSVVVPTRDSASILDACLASVGSQTHSRVELIVVDNGSTDGTLDIARRHADRVISAGSERSAQRNIGAAAARGEIVVFIDSDMVLPPDVVAEVVETFHDDRSLRAVVVPERSEGGSYWARCRALEKSLYVGDPAVEAARAFPRKVFQEVGGFDEQLWAGEDWDLADRVDPTGESTGRVQATIVHDEQRLGLREDLSKKLYYGRSLRRYLWKQPRRGVSRIARLSLVRKLPIAARDPVHAAGMIVMKLLELAAVSVGMVVGLLAPRSPDAIPDPQRRKRNRTFLAPAAFAFLASQTWFVSGKFIATGDVGPFVRDNLTAEGFGLWSHALTGAGSPSFQSAARAPEVALLGVSHALGLSDAFAQRIFYSLLAVAVVVAAVYFVLAFVRPGFAAGLAGLVALINPYVLQHLPNPLPLWTLGLMAATGGVVLRAAQGRRPSVRALVGLSLFAGYLVLNPPLLLVAVLWVVLLACLGSLLTGEGGSKRALGYVLRAFPLMVLVNLWWIVPYWLTLSDSGTGVSLAAQTDVQAWAWTQARLSIPNVLTVSGQWGWAYPQYFPYAASLDSGVWGWLKFGLPALAFLAPFFAPRDRRRAALALVGTIGILAFLSKGLHSPFSSANLFLYRHVPGMWLFREPLSKLGPALVLCYVALIPMTVNGALDVARQMRGASSSFVRGTATAMALGVVLYPAPVWTGHVIPDQRPILPSAHVQVPADWQRIADQINGSPLPGKVLVLPLDDYYQMPTTWNYYGVDSIPKVLIARPTIQMLPGGYFNALPGYSDLVHRVQSALMGGDVGTVPRLLRALGVTYVIVRNDIDQNFSLRQMTDPSPIETGLRATPEVKPVGSYTVANLFQLENGSGGSLSGYGSSYRLDSSDAADTSLALASIPGGAIANSPEVSAQGSVNVVPAVVGSVRMTSEGGRAVVSPRATDPQLFQIRAASRSHGSVLEFRPLSWIRLDGSILPTPTPRPIRIRTGEIAAVGVDGQLSTFRSDGATLALGSATKMRVYVSDKSPTLPADLRWRLGDCNAYDQRSISQVGIAAQPLQGEPGSGVRLTANDHSACVSTRVRGFTPGASYQLRLQYRSVSGNAPRLCLWQEGPNRCAVLPPLGDAPGWHAYSTSFTPQQGTKGLRLFLYADGEPGQGVTTAEYRAVGMTTLRPVASRTVRLGQPQARSIDWEAGTHVVSLSGTSTSSFASGLSPASDCNAYDERSISQVGIAAQPLPGEAGLAVRLSAIDHSACVSTPVRGFVPGASYQLRLQYRSVSGSAPRLCLWQEGPNRCAVLPPLDDAPGWNVYRANVAPQRGTEGLRLFLYADAAEQQIPTITEYRSLDIAPALPFAVTVVQRPPYAGDAPSMDSFEMSPSSYVAQVGAAKTPFLLVLRDSFSPRWQLTGLAPSRVEAHVSVDGYANGWWISPGPSATVRVDYGPDRWVHQADFVSLIAFFLLVTGSILARRRRSSPSGAGVAGVSAETA